MASAPKGATPHSWVVVSHADTYTNKAVIIIIIIYPLEKDPRVQVLCSTEKRNFSKEALYN